MGLSRDEVIGIFRECGAILEGHFILTSGLRSPVFVQKVRVFQYPDKTEILCRALAERIREAGLGRIDAVIAPAVGGIVPGYETARHLGVRSLFVEREGGEFKLRRFELAAGARVVVVDDVVTTGLSSRETIAAIEALGADVLAFACLIDRSAGTADVGAPMISLAEFAVPAYPPDALPPELEAIPPVKPGSRGLS